MADTDKPKKPKSMRELFKRKPSGVPEVAETVVEPDKVDIDEPEVEAETKPADDPKTDAAVEDIMKKDGDEALKIQDEAAAKATVMKTGFGERVRNFFSDWWASPRKRYTSLGMVVVVLAVVGAVPLTRYSVAGLVMKSAATVTVVDSKTGKPVTGATVTLAGKTAETDASGKVALQVHAGSKTLQVSKKYYKSTSQKELVALSGNSFKLSLVALGHQVQVKVVNKITGKPVANAVVNVQGGNTKTDAKGLANVVIASSATIQEASVSLSGYNTTKVNITASGDLAKNTFSVVPAGKLYFLSNLSGKIDVVKTDLDGSDRQTVLAGTGNEDPNSTSLLASRDWKYLALLSKRSGDNASVYLIDTTNNDKLTTIDEGNATFSLVGWSGDKFVYQVTRSTVADWQSGQEVLKSFDPTTNQTSALDQTQGGGSQADAFYKQQFSETYLIGDQVVYGKSWVDVGDGGALLDKQGEIDTIAADGSGHKVVKQFAYTPNPNDSNYYTTISVSTQLYAPDSFYIEVADNGYGATHYDYDNGTVTADTSASNDLINPAAYHTYLLSPSGNQTFWSEARDGKNALFTGNADGKSVKQIASLSDYSTYGWYTDNYLLVSKNSSELYIMSATGGAPLKITDYYKPAINYNGYGGGYGGL